jgi:Holliday junction DNA helicase RuvA
VREDQLALYGFATELELMMFERLIAVSGIGPKLALAVLSGIEPRDLAGAIQRNDLARLTAIPGVGKKTAERICVELRDRLPKAIEASPASPADSLRDDLVSALVNLGYHRQAIDKALDKLSASAKASASAEASTFAAATADKTAGQGRRFEDVLRSALKELSRS